MKKHLHVLLTLVAFVGLVNGLGGSSSGGAGGSAVKSGVPGATASENSTAESSNGQVGSRPSGNGSSPGAISSGKEKLRSGGTGGSSVGDTSRSTTGSTGGGARANAAGAARSSVAGSSSAGAGAASAGQTSGTSGPGTAAGADSQSGQSRPGRGLGSSISGVAGGRGASAASTGRSSEAASGGSSGLPGRSAATIRPSSGSTNGAEAPNRSPGDARSVGNRNGGASGLLGASAGFGPFGSGSGPAGGSPVAGFGPSLGGDGGEPGANDGEFERLGPGLLSEGPSFGVRERSPHGFDAFARGGSVAFGNRFSDPSIGGVGGAAGGSAPGRRRLGDEGLFGEETDFTSAFGASGFDGNRGTGFPTSGISSSESGFGGDFGTESFGRGWNRGAGGFGGSAPGFGDFSSGGNTDFGVPDGEFGLPERQDGRPGPSGGSSDGENGPLPGLFTQQGPGPLPGSENRRVGSAGWPSRENFNGFDESGVDSSRGSSSPATNGPVGPVRSGLFRRFWQRRRDGQGHLELGRRLRRPDPRLAAAIAVGTLAGATALTGLGAGIAAAILASRTRDAAGLGGRRRLCVGRCRARERRINMGLKAAQDIFSRIPRSVDRLQ